MYTFCLHNFVVYTYIPIEYALHRYYIYNVHKYV